MIKLEEQELDTNIPHRRRGNAFDTLSHFLRNIKEVVFRNSFVMRNRPSKITNSSNVFEMYADNDTTNDSNFIYIGRSGGESLNRNMGYLELTANSSTAKKDLNVANGVILIVLSKDKVVNTYGQIALADANAISPNDTGTLAIQNGEGDGTSNDKGGAYMSYRNNSNGNMKSIVIDKDGIKMIGLPTSPSGLPTGAIYSDSGTLKIVT